MPFKNAIAVILCSICFATANAQVYRCIFDNPSLEIATAEISSDKYVNQYGDLTSKAYRLENEIITEADLVKKYYFEGDLLTAQRNYTIQGELTTDEAGISIYEYQYDANRNLIKIQYFDEGKLAAQAAFAGPAMIEYAYDTRNNRIKAVYYNKYYELLDLGVSIIEYTYDEQNRLVKEMHFDAERQLLADSAPIVHYHYDDSGKVIKQEFLNAKHEMVTRLMDNDESDVAFISFEYDTNEKVSMKHYYNIKGVLLGSEDAEDKK